MDGAPLWRSAGLFLAEPLRRFLLEDSPGTSGTAEQRIVVLESRSEDDALLVAERAAADEGDRLVRLDVVGAGSRRRPSRTRC